MRYKKKMKDMRKNKWKVTKESGSGGKVAF